MIKQSFDYLQKLKPIHSIASFSRKFIIPGTGGLALSHVLRVFIKGIQKGSITSRASATAFNFFLAVFPSIIFLFTLIPYVPIDNFQDQLMDLMKQFMPRAAFEATESTLEDIIKNQHGSLLSFGFVAALYFSTNGFNAMIEAFNSSYHSIESRSLLMQRLISLLLVFILTMLILTAVSLIIVSEFALHKIFHRDLFASYLIQIGRILIIFSLFFFVISFTFYLGPSKKTGWKFFTPGSFLATALSILTSVGFAFYVNNFGQYNKLYGSIGTLIVVLLWIYFNSLVILIGFELNASIHTAKRDKEIRS